MRIGDHVEISGQGGWNDDPEIPDALEEEIVRAFRNVEQTVATAGAGWAHLVHVNSYHVGGFPPVVNKTMAKLYHLDAARGRGAEAADDAHRDQGDGHRRLIIATDRMKLGQGRDRRTGGLPPRCPNGAHPCLGKIGQRRTGGTISVAMRWRSISVATSQS